MDRTARELKIRDYSPKTVKSYLYALKEYFAFKNRGLEVVDTDNIKDFLLSCQKKGISAQTRSLFLNAIKFYYRNVIRIDGKIEIRSAKANKSLPVVLSRSEIEEILEATENTKHKLLLSLAYGAGLRVSEVVSLKVRDIDLDELTVHLKNAKGKKDRITIFPEKLKGNMQNLIAGKDKNDFGGGSVKSLAFDSAPVTAICEFVVPRAGVEPARVAPQDSKSCVSANSTTSAKQLSVVNF